MSCGQATSTCSSASTSSARASTSRKVSLVSILDADKEGFLRSATSLIQTIGRAARNLHGEVHMYADTITRSMRQAIDETDRRREVQRKHNEEHGIDPQPLVKKLSDITERLRREDADTREILAEFDYGKGKRGFNGRSRTSSAPPSNAASPTEPRWRRPRRIWSSSSPR